MTDKELERAQVSELSRRGHIVLTTRTRKGMVHLRVVVNRGKRIRIERRMNLRLGFGRAKLVEPRDVQHQRAAQILCFIETLLDTDAVITNRTIRLEAH